MDALLLNIWICVAACILTWGLSLLTREHSWVDRLWSVVPVIYLWVFAAGAGLSDWRLNVMALLGTLWGVRLTLNFARKGGYAPGGEDYRWAVLRARMPRLAYELFNVFFIVIYQNFLLLLITMPALTVLLSEPSPFTVLDVVLTLLFLGLLVMETIADQQQWNFHQWKKSEAEAGRNVSPPFLTTGLFSVSRHPNFFAEQAQWWVMFLFAVAATGSALHWTILGPILLTLLFIGSTRFTEQISLGKYPEYAEYQSRVSMLIPWPPRHDTERRVDAANSL